MECKQCGRPFFGGKRNQEYCSPECRKKAQSDKYYQDKKEVKKRCLWCGNEYITYKTLKKYCSEKCRVNAFQQIRMRAYKATHQPAFLRLRFQILERDKFRCHYCGRGIEDGVKLQVDHIIAKNKGGQNELSNYITACEECNLGKGDILLLANIEGQLPNFMTI